MSLKWTSVPAFCLQIFSIMALLLLAACDNQGAVQFAPQATEPVVQLATFDHPSGAFSLDVPEDWVSYVQEDANLASVTFYLPDTIIPLLTVVTVRLDATDQSTELIDLVNAYQQGVRADVDAYSEQSREQLTDGSWRMTGIRVDARGDVQQVNTFIERAGELFTVAEVYLPTSSVGQISIELALNTLRYREDTTLQATSILTVSTVNTSSLGVINVATWSTSDGVFFVTGEVANHFDRDIGPVEVRVSLLDADQNVLVDAVDVSMGHGIVANGFAPFSLRFGQGRPANLSELRINIVGQATATEMVDFVQGNMLSGTSQTDLSSDGQLTISGDVLNNGEVALTDVLIIVTVFDNQQRVIAGRFFVVVDDTLAPSTSESYAVLIPELGGTPVDYIIELQALPDA